MVTRVFHLRDGPKRPLSDRRPADHVGQGEDVLLDLWREAQQTQDLGHAGARDPFSTGDLSLVRDVNGVELPPPLLGRLENLDHLRGLGSLGRLPVPGLCREGVDGLVRCHPSFQGAHDPGLESPLGPQGDFHRLIAIGGHRGPVRAFLGDMDDPEPDLGPGPAGPAAVSRTVTFGEPNLFCLEIEAREVDSGLDPHLGSGSFLLFVAQRVTGAGIWGAGAPQLRDGVRERRAAETPAELSLSLRIDP